MPDFERLVAERLARLNLTPAQQREIVTEISAHLEEFYRARVAAGSPDPEGQTLAQVADWSRFRRRIQRAKEDRMRVARTVVLPGLAAVALAWITFKVSVFFLVQPVACRPELDLPSRMNATWYTHCSAVVANTPLYFVWLATLPFAGALGAVFARRAGARPLERLIVAVFPALANTLETALFTLPEGFFWSIPLYWVLVPAILCAFGALPFLRGRQNVVARKQDLQDIESRA